MAGIQSEQKQKQEQEQESPILPSLGSLHPDASNSEPNNPPPTPPLSTIQALTPDKTPAASCNLLSWFRHPLATFTASLKRRRCASSGDSSKAGRKKKAQILGDTCAEDNDAAEAKARQEKEAPGSDPELLIAESIPKAIGASTTTAHIIDCLNDNDDEVYVRKEDMAIGGKEEKARAKEQQGSPENAENKWVSEPINDITGGNNHKVAIMSSSTIEEAAAARPVAENAEAAAAPATEDTAVTAVSGIRSGN